MLGWAGETADVAIPREVEPVLVVLLLGLVTDYAVFFLSAFRDALPEAGSKHAAMRAATAGTARVVLTAGVIVAAGTAALVAGRLDFFRAFGPGLAITALIAVAVCLTFIPACLALFGRRLAPPRGAPRTAGDEEQAPAVPSERLPERVRFRLAAPVSALQAARRAADERGVPRRRVLAARIATSRPVAIPVVLGCCVLLLVAASGVRHLDLGMTLVPSLPARRPGADRGGGRAAGLRARCDRAGRGDPRARRDREDLDGLGALEDELRGEPGVAAVLGPGEERGLTGGGVATTDDGGAARIAVLLDHEPGSATAIDTVDRLEARLPGLVDATGLGRAVPLGAAAAPDAVAVGLSGETALGGDTVDAVVGDLWRIALAALALNLLFLVIFMRALVAPLYLLGASVLGYAAGLGLTVLVFQGVLGYDGLTYYVPLATAVLLVSLGSDYNVFVAGRIWAEARTRRLREAVAVATPQAAGAVTVAGLTLAASFALLALVPLRSFREFALLMVIGVLIDTLLVRSLLLPGLISMFGEKSWWPGRRIAPPPHREVLAAVAARTGAGEPEADRILRATLSTISERITRREAKALCTQLPAAFRTAITGVRRHAEPFGLDEFAARVSERAGVDRERRWPARGRCSTRSTSSSTRRRWPMCAASSARSTPRCSTAEAPTGSGATRRRSRRQRADQPLDARRPAELSADVVAVAPQGAGGDEDLAGGQPRGDRRAVLVAGRDPGERHARRGGVEGRALEAVGELLVERGRGGAPAGRDLDPRSETAQATAAAAGAERPPLGASRSISSGGPRAAPARSPAIAWPLENERTTTRLGSSPTSGAAPPPGSANSASASSTITVACRPARTAPRSSRGGGRRRPCRTAR